MTSNLPVSQNNSLLAALSEEVRQRIIPLLELVTLPLGQVIYESGDIVNHVFFPIDSIISMLYVMENGASAEISVIGNDGVIGVALLMGGDSMPSRAIVQSAGQAYKIKAHLIKEEFYHHGELEKLVLRFTQCLFTQMSQTAACNRHHSIDQQLCRWILLSLDRLPTNQLNMTQELIANMLGVRREGVTEAAGKLQRKGVIEYSRGHITVLDRPKLEELSCECYAAVKRETDRLLPYSRPRPTRVDEITAAASSIELRQNAEARTKRTVGKGWASYWANLALDSIPEGIRSELANVLRSHHVLISQDVLQALMSMPDVFIYVKDVDHNFLYASDTNAMLSKHESGKELVGKNDFDLFPLEHATLYFEAEKPVIEEGKVLNWHEEPQYDQHGHLRWFASTKTPVRDCNGKIIGLVGISKDITEKKQAEEKLARAASVFAHTQESIMITDATGNITEVNDAFSRITGYAAEDVVGKNPRLLQSGRHPPEFYVEMWAAIGAQGHWRGEIWNRRKNGEVYAEMITISAAKNAEGQVQHYVSLSTDITPMKTYQRQLERSAHYDALTNLPNRVLLADRLNQAMTQSQRQNRLVAVVFMDLDGFKAVNDAHGHKVGDELLIAVSLRMKEALREGDTLARIGGDEFIAVMGDLETVEDSEIVLERLLKAAADPITIDDAAMQVSASIGVTIYPQNNSDADRLIRNADQAMYIAKQKGKNRYQLFETPQN